MDTNHFFCKIVKISQEESGTEAKDNNKIDNSFNNFKMNILRYNESDTKVFNQKMKSFHLNFHHKIEHKLSEIKSENAIQKRIQTKSSTQFNNDSMKKNNYLKEEINKDIDLDKIKSIKNEESSNVSNDSFENSNKEMNKNKRIDSLSLLKEKNSEYNYDMNSITSKNKNDITKNNDNANNNICIPPKRKSKVTNNYHNNKIMYRRPSFQISNLEEIVKTQKLNKNMIQESDYFEKKFTFSYFIFCSCLKNHKENKYKNLYSLINFRKKILSENFLFQQHIINLLLVKKSGIDPHEFKNIM
jgi:hypothetical protein